MRMAVVFNFSDVRNQEKQRCTMALLQYGKENQHFKRTEMCDTLQQIKDEYARENGYPSFDEMENFIIDTSLPVNIAVLLSAAWREICRRYAAACSIKIGDKVVTQEKFNEIYSQYSEMLTKADAQEWVAKEAQTFKETKEEYARRCCEATLIKAAENAEATPYLKYYKNGSTDWVAVIDSSSITNPDNIVIL